MGPTRQTRGRSRTGCTQCRRDRKKCDEERPVCGRCMNRRTACDFERPFGASVGNRRRSPMSSALSDTSYDEAPGPNRIGHSMSGTRSGSMTMRTPGPMWATTPRPEDHSVSIGSIGSTSQQRDGYHGAQNGPSGSGIHDFHSDSQFLASAVPGTITGTGTGPNVATMPGIQPAMVMAPVSPFDHIDLSVGDESISFDDLLKDLFGASMPDMTTGMAYVTAHMQEASERPGPVRSPNVEPHSVQQRFNAPLDTRAALRGTVPQAALDMLSDTDARLIHHFVDVQSTISIAIELDTHDNPFVKHFVPVALSSTMSGNNDDNPALHAIKATAATHRANLMDSTRTEGSGVWRDLAHSCRKRAYTLIAAKMAGFARAEPEERERILGAFAQLVGLAVVDGNTRLLPGLYEAFSVALRSITNPTEHEQFFIVLTSMWQTMFNFSIGVLLRRPMLKPLVDALPNRPHSTDADNVFASPYERAEEFMRVYTLLEQARRHDTASVLAAQLEADELISSLGHRLQHDLSHYASLSGPARRVSVGSLLANAALRVILLRHVFQCPIEDHSVQQCVRDALQVLPTIKWGTESGLLISLLILSTSALPAEQAQYRTFMVRLCWKGSAGPRAALTALDAVCAGEDWMQALVQVGAPVLV
ncbi:hypothetical protein CspeluHIS016_0114640 [Cutaneotrichosporon spelunceum]|uniref:Zn(2)-C6 fungal-type domain-containing protein n=1 Tax=Cutaneotrichosporon spelunceum TaxID=1672016 RepID=A0AAD3YAB7_9TREE|nr:hypothetical protein CspeluHIS016_0114640 [Cutaneotrichosporon spelunceum]